MYLDTISLISLLSKLSFSFPLLSLKDKILLKLDAFDIRVLYTFFRQFWNLVEKFFSLVNKLFIKLMVLIDESKCSPVNSLIKSSIYAVNLLFNSEFIYSF